MTITPESVQKLLSSEDFGDRIRGINQLRHLEPEISFTLVQPLMTDNNTRIRYAAVSQFDTLGSCNLEKSLELLLDRLLRDSEADVKAAAADSLAALKLTEAFEYLQEAYVKSSDWLLQFSILAALGELGDPRGFDLLKEALSNENSLLQITAISALGELGDINAVPLLTPFATNEDWQIRYRLAQALGRLGGEESREILVQLAHDEFEQVAQEAQRNL